MNDINLITEPTGDMEIVETSAATPELALKLGREQAARWTARGYACECIGVTPHTASVLTLEAAENIRDDHYTVIERSGYRPVLRARA
jgi:hypothetical protein